MTASSGARGQDRGTVAPTTSPAPITLFSIAKSFHGDAGPAQRNAIASWLRLAPQLEVCLLGDDAGTAETAAELGVRHLTGIQTNANGTPLVSSAFQRIHAATRSPVLVYCNCDVILMESFVEALLTLQRANELESFLAIGRRTDADVPGIIDFGDREEIARWWLSALRSGRRAPVVCKEYFAFSRDLFSGLPEFAVGRGNWDSWMVATARRRGWPVVNISRVAPVLHQRHAYGGGKRRHFYVTGDEARENERLAGGKNLIRGSSATWDLTAKGLQERRLPILNQDFWLDLPRFLGLLIDLAAS